MSFNGYLVKLIAANNAKTEIPLEYIRYSTYKITPNQRLDLDTGLRDITGVMHRNVVQHEVSKLEWNCPSMSNSKLNWLLTLLRNHWRDPLQRDVYLEYYDMETDSYKTGHFYIPDIDYSIRNIDAANNIINYNETRIAFIEY